MALTKRLLLTNAHVVAGESEVLLVLDDRVLRATVVQVDAVNDRALLDVTDSVLQPVPGVRSVVDRANRRAGVLVGVSQDDEGVCVGLSIRELSTKRGTQAHELIQTSAPISPGSSGGGLFDRSGNLIGITTTLVRDAQNLNGAIPIDEFLAP